MKVLASVASAMLILAGCTARADEGTVKVLVLGTYHMNNPGKDLHDPTADDVTTPERQRQLEEVAQKLAKFKPTKIALEGVASTDDFTSEKYREFTPADLKTERGEGVQIGYRLAHALGRKNVYLIDETSDVIDYFPYGEVQKYAKEKGETAALDALNAAVSAEMKDFDARQSRETIAQLLAFWNDPEKIENMNDAFYYSLLKFADREEQPGAELNAYWYMRNAKIFSKLIQIAKPGDRIVVVFGAGHAYWLRHFAQHTPGFELVEANDYLR